MYREGWFVVHQKCAQIQIQNVVATACAANYGFGSLIYYIDLLILESI